MSTKRRIEKARRKERRRCARLWRASLNDIRGDIVESSRQIYKEVIDQADAQISKLLLGPSWTSSPDARVRHAGPFNVFEDEARDTLERQTLEDWGRLCTANRRAEREAQARTVRGELVFTEGGEPISSVNALGEEIEFE